MRHLGLLLVLLISIFEARACLSAFQYKVFPLGIRHDSVFTIDYKLHRMSAHQGNNVLKLGLSKADPGNAMWLITGMVSIYDKHQRLLYTKPSDSSYCIGASYGDTLRKSFLRLYKTVEKKFSNLELFEPQYISFCNYQQKCSRLSLSMDSISKQSVFCYQGQFFPIHVLNDTNYYPIRYRNLEAASIDDLYLNSIRLYKTKSITLVIGFLTLGDEIYNGLITHNPKEAGLTEEGEVIFLKEVIPKIPFGKSILTTTYAEPILHHGFGLDVFVVATH